MYQPPVYHRDSVAVPQHKGHCPIRVMFVTALLSREHGSLNISQVSLFGLRPIRFPGCCMKLMSRMLAIAAVLAWPACAQAQDSMLGAAAFDISVDVRLPVADGEVSWTDHGFGKLRYGGSVGKVRVSPEIAAVDIAWKPEFSWNFSGLVSVTHQSGQSEPLDLSEAFVQYRSNPGTTRIAVRAGMFWPPISQEHSGPHWNVTDSITPSAINTWVGEEVKAVGLEVKLDRKLGEHKLAATLGAFGFNDTSGTLLSYRGWALHDIKGTLIGDLPLPPLSPFIATYQAQETYPTWELDSRVGYYARIDWQPPAPFTVYAIRYDNRGDRVSSRNMQTAWDTRFWNIGGAWSLGPKATIKTQVMWGETLVGPATPFGFPVDVDFMSAYLLATRQLGPGRLTIRADYFRTDDDSFIAQDNNNEHGWAGMIAYLLPLGEKIELRAELLHIESSRPGRQLYGGLPMQQDQTQLQTSVRIRL